MPTISVNVNVPAFITKEDDVYVAVCPLLDLASQGCTRDEARENLKEAISIFVETCLEMGTLNQVLEQCGFSRSTTVDTRENGEEVVDVTLPYFAAKKHCPECHA